MDADPANPRHAGSRRQYLTLLFADLCDSTLLGDMMEGEHYASLLGDLRVLCRAVVARHGGEIARIQGDGLLAFFGWPSAAEDDGCRAVMAALDLHSGIARLPVVELPRDRPLRMHSGIHAGLVLVSEGDVERGRFELVGNVPNIAAHLSSLADEDDIVVSEETLGPHHRLFLTGERQTIRVGKLEAPLVVYKVLGRAATQHRHADRARADLSPFVGRDAELKALHTALREATAGANLCCVVSAPAGMGKSRLVEELVRQAAGDGTCALRGTSDEHLGAAPLQPFVQAIRGYCDDMTAADSDRDKAFVARAQNLLATGVDQSGDTSLRELVQLFADLAATRPVLFVLDDWQWADEASQKVLEGLRGLDRSMLLLLGTRTAPNELLLSRHAQAIVLEPLDARATARMMEVLLPGADPFVAADIHRHAGGNPLYLEELCHAARVPGWTSRTGLRLPGPAWLSGLIESRVGRLPAAQAEAVRCAAVLGNTFPGWLLEQITGYAADDPEVRALAAADLVFEGEQTGTLRFKHGITRDVIYGTIGLEFRRRMHLRVAKALQDADDKSGIGQHVEALAYHCAAGGRFESAARYAELAGDRAMAASALDRARTQYTAALRAMDEQAPFSADVEARWCEVAQKLGQACVFDPLSLSGGLALFERALLLARHSGRLDLLARAEYWLGYMRYARGQSVVAGVHCEAALDLARQLGDERMTAQVRAVYGQVLLSAGRYDEALPLLDAALQVRRQRSAPSRSVATGAAYTLACRGYLLGDRGRFVEAEECFNEALRLIGDARHQVASSVRHWRCVVFQWQGRWADALHMADDSAAIAEYTRSRQQLLMGRAMAGYVRWVTSHRNDDLQALRDATTWIEACDGGLGMSLNHGWMVEAALASGLQEEARRHAARLFMRKRKSDRLGEALGCRALALNAARLNQFAVADRYLARAKESALARGSAHETACNRLCEAQVLLDRGADAHARANLEQAIAGFELMSMPWHLERARRLAIQAGS